MSYYNISVPLAKQSFFEEFLKMIPVNYEKIEDDDFILSSEQKNILDSQDNVSLSDFQDADEFLLELRKEYGF